MEPTVKFSPTSTRRGRVRSQTNVIRNTFLTLLKRRQPHETQYEIAYALQVSGDFEGALVAYQALYPVALGDWRIPCGFAACARAAGQLDRASAIIDKALLDFPQEPHVIGEAAQIQEQRGRWAESLAYWEQIIHALDVHVEWRHHYLQTLIMLGSFDQAELMLCKWRRDDPDYHGFMAMEAMLAASRDKVDEALALWSVYRRRFPDDRTGWEHYGRAYQAKQMALLDGADPNAIDQLTPETIERQEDPAAYTLLMTFESLGDNCEFGLVQRRFGAEPLGLLRFNAVGYGELLTAIANRFASMGEPDLTEMIVSGNGEFYVKDRRWGLGMHTFVFEGQESRDVLYKKFCRRVAYLRDRFLEDRADGRKVLVFTNPGLAIEDLKLLHAALRSLGPTQLLHVVFASTMGHGIAEGPPGTVSDLGDGLYIGYISRPGRMPGSDWDIAYDEWVTICSQVQDLIANQRPMVLSPPG